MNATQWILFILIIQVIHFLGTWKLYVKAGRKAWEAAIPVYNAIVLMQIINRPKWWTILLFIPIINLLMFPVIWVETIRSFGRNTTLETWLVVFTLGFYIYYVNYALDVKYIDDRSLQPKTAMGEWVSSILFAIVAATLVHTYFIQPYVIPTGSLERTLRVGDFLFVSKFNYGARTPMTTVAAPMVHDTIPVLGIPSYLKKPQLPYFRLPGFTKVKRSDIVVFSWPADTVRVFFKKEKGVKKPIDKKSNYVKRCVGIPGDSLEVRDGHVFVNSKPLELPGSAKPQYDYTIYSSKGVSSRTLQKIGVTDFTRKYLSPALNQEQAQAVNKYLIGYNQGENGKLELFTKASGFPVDAIKKYRLSLQEVTDRQRQAPLTAEMVATLRKDATIDSIVQKVNAVGKRGNNLFPQSPDYPWNYSQLGPIYIPKKGTTVQLNLKQLPLYKKIIREYEGNEISVSGNQISINGKPATSYTFKQDYYWMMGDNRDHSEDSRAWGYVPENHIVGTPIFIWMSFDNFTEGISNWRPRWDRIFTTVNGDGEPKSYFKYFLILLGVYFVGNWFWKKEKNKTKSAMNLVHPTYFPNLINFSFIAGQDVCWEVSDNYQKQTLRNRIYICNDRGLHLMTIPIIHVGNKEGRQKYKDVRIDNSYPWQRQHWRTLETAYRTSPFFEYYEDEIEPLYKNTFDNLLEFNLKTIETILDCLQLEIPKEKTTVFEPIVEGKQDLRYLTNTKQSIKINQEPYVQVFGDRHDFLPNLSILDLLFNMGPNASTYLKGVSLAQKDD